MPEFLEKFENLVAVVFEDGSDFCVAHSGLNGGGSLLEHAENPGFGGFLAVLLLTLPLSKYLNRELQMEVARTAGATIAGIVTAAWLVLRVWLSYRAARCVLRWVSAT